MYNVAYRRVGAYKGMGRLHPANYLEIGSRPNRIGAAAGQYNTLSGQLALLPPSLRGLGRDLPVWSWRPRFWRRGLGQSTEDILAQMQGYAQTQLATGAVPQPDYVQGATNTTNMATTFSGGSRTVLLIAGGALLLLLMARR